ncbi:hypothetical protein [Phenylobacterium sp.]|uniref:hypothetical protein n=1 Tax=Phenylobacterium sp. TaxID=1871053 RepID=UPI002FCB4A1B
MNSNSNPLVGFLQILAGAPAEYRLSGLIVVAFFFVVWRTSANPNVARIFDRAINEKVGKAQAYRLVRLVITVLFWFSVILTVLAFTAPMITNLLNTFKVGTIARAYEELKSGRYSQSRRLYESALAAGPDDATAEQIRGMITATYYGEGLHREGLEYICKIYGGRAPDDTRYVFAVQAHIRAISIRDGWQVAESTASELKNRCRRTDFSAYWAHIPFGAMELLRKSETHVARYLPNERDRVRLSQLISETQKNFPREENLFTDYALYFLKRYPESLSRYPRSKIRDMTLLEYANASEWPKNVALYEQYAKEFPHGGSIIDVYMSLSGELAENGKLERALVYAKLLEGMGNQSAAYLVLSPTLDRVYELIGTADFQSAGRAIQNACKLTESKGLPCLDELKEAKSDIDKISSLIAYTPPQRCRFVFMSIRDLERRRGARSYLDGCLDVLKEDPLEYGRGLYQAAMISRKLGEYDKSLNYLVKFQEALSEHPLMDDVLSETGWHKLFILRDWVGAQESLLKVIEKYPERNAYDNALWILAAGENRAGNYARSAAYYTEIVAGEAREQIRQVAFSRSREASAIAGLAVFQGLSWDSDDEMGLFITNVSGGTTAQRVGLRSGDVVEQICNDGYQDCSAYLSKFNDLGAGVRNRLGRRDIRFVFRRKSLRFGVWSPGPYYTNWHREVFQD